MKNKDFLQQKRKAFAASLKAAFDEKDEAKMLSAFETYADDIQQSLLEAAQEVSQTADSAILARRGLRQLTSVEQKFYSNLSEAMKSPDPKQALSGAEVTIPQTVIDTVLTDIESNHPLLAAFNIQNTFGAVKWIYSDDTQQLAQWGALTSEIAKELSENIHAIEFGTNKLSAFIPVPKDLIDLAPAYLDAYVRRILADALAYGLEYGFIKGSGKDEPIGVIKDLKGSVLEGVYSDKSKVALKSFGVKDYCGVVSKLSKKSSGKSRVVSSVDLIVNPTDYIEKVIPATTVLATDGTYKGNIFPFPTKVYQSEMVEQGTAVLGLINRYVPCLSTGKEGKVEYSDQYQFLEDNRVYLIKLYGTGRAKDNNDFVYLDISALEPLELSVTLKNSTEETA